MEAVSESGGILELFDAVLLELASMDSFDFLVLAAGDTCVAGAAGLLVVADL